MGRKKQVRSLKLQVMGIIFLCWLVPVLMVLGVMGWYISDSLSQRTEKTLKEQFHINVHMCVERMDSAAEASRQASYDPAIKQAWAAYQGGGSYTSCYRQIRAFLDQQYRADNRFRFAVFWLRDEPEKHGMSTLTESAGAKYLQVLTFWEEDFKAAEALAATLDTSIGFLRQKDRLYLVRNVVNTNFKTIGTLVLALNPPYYFDNLTTLPWASAITISLNGVDEPLTDVSEGNALSPADYANVPQDGFPSLRGEPKVLYETATGRGYTLSAAARVDYGVLLAQFSGYKYLLMGMALLLAPLILFTVWFLRRKVSLPVEALMAGAREIEEGQLGHQLSYQANSREFQYLADSFNHMSGRLRHQFDRLYQEELALRDARIKALQSQINPHFLNNTLEIINWEARMNGDAKVSKMIEALSTMLDAAIDRRKRPEVSLAEELTYVNAYLYIVSERFGKRLEVRREIPLSLQAYMVPRLILQPVIENAVEHGISPGGRGVVILRGRREGDLLILETINEGTLSPENRVQIDQLLSPDVDLSRESAGNVGISNVNQRLRILCGPPSGLTIQEEGEHTVVARITIALGSDRVRSTDQNTPEPPFPVE